LVPILSPEELQEKLDEIVRRLRDALDPVAIYFFGSYAYGTPESHSDIDRLVVVEDSPLSPYKRDAIACRALGNIRHPIDVQVYTWAEFEERAALPVSFERTVKHKGKVVYAA
jgi:predicted nucleotidyltransferase